MCDPNVAETFAFEDVSRYIDGVRIIPDFLILNQENNFIYQIKKIKLKHLIVLPVLPIFGKGKCVENILSISDSSTTFSHTISILESRYKHVQGAISSASGHGQFSSF